MARKEVEIISDDLTGVDGAEPVTFGIDGAHFEIDLNADNAKQLRAAYAEFINHARRVSPAYQAALTRKARATRSSRVTAQPAKRTLGLPGLDAAPATIRAWALANGYSIGDRGRVSAEIRAAYRRSIIAGHLAASTVAPKVLVLPAPNDAVRAWARSNGYSVKSKGRVSQSLRDAYDRAQSKS